MVWLYLNLLHEFKPDGIDIPPSTHSVSGMDIFNSVLLRKRGRGHRYYTSTLTP